MFTFLDRFQSFAALVLRLTLGAIMFAHGYSKIIPTGALYGFVRMVAHMGIPAWLGYVSAFTEFFGGILLILGLLTRLAALFCAINMAVAILKVHLPHGLTGQGGFEFPLSLFAIAVALVAMGGGLLAVDAFLIRGRGAEVRTARVVR